ncbi:hypothetical protein ACEWY4_021630 [Coilia grayii]|uniref:Knl1 C-terminal RWD domain-containing protein n=1 Tax=Coilia grayii TaxID=363190 RepID=A0ABD1J3R1_9TELE
MDMTQCNTILIDKHSDKSALNFSINTEMPLSRFGEPAPMEDGLQQKSRCLTDMSNTYPESTEPTSDFGAFLAIVSQKKAAGNAKATNRDGDVSQQDLELRQKADREAAFGMFLASLSNSDGLGSTAKHAESSPGVQFSSPVFMTPSLDSDIFLAKTKKIRHGVIEKENQPFTLSGCPVSKPQGFHLERSRIPSVDGEVMNLKQHPTGAIDGGLGGLLPSQQAALTDKSLAVAQDRTNPSRQGCGDVADFSKLSGPDDMDFTTSHTAAVNFKSIDEARPSLSNVQRADRFGLDPNKTHFFSDDTDMEFTKSHTAAVNFKSMDAARPSLSNVQRVDQCGLDPNKTHFFSDDTDMEFTKSHTAAVNFKSMDAARPSLSNVQRVDRFGLDPNKTHFFSDDTDMEFTKSHTAAVNFKSIDEARPSLNNVQRVDRFGLDPNKTHFFSDDTDMEFTKSHTAAVNFKSMDEERPSLSNVQRVDQCGLDPNKTHFFSDDTDMEFTKSHTAAVNFKSMDEARPSLNNVQRVDRFGLDPNKTHFFSDDTGMEFTGVIEEQENAPGPQQKICNFQKDLCAVDSADADDMEVTKSQTVMIDTKGQDERSSGARKSVSVNRSVMFTQNVREDGGEAFRGHTEASQLDIPGSIPMGFKNRRVTGPALLSSSLVDVAGVQTDLTESNPSHRGSVLRNRRSISCVSSALRHTMLGKDPCPEGEAAMAAAAGDEVEKAVDIDAKHKMMNTHDDPKVHIQTAECRNSILPMTHETFASSRMTDQVTEVQISTACDNQGFTTDKATAVDSNPTGVTDGHKMTTKTFFPFESLASQPCVSEEVITDLSFVTGQKKNFFPSLTVSDVDLTRGKHVMADSQVVRKSMSCMEEESKSQSFSTKGHDMKTKLSETSSQEQYEPLQEDSSAVPVPQGRQRDIRGESSSSSSVWDDNDDSGKPHGVFPMDTVTKSDNLICHKTKSRRRSFLDLQTKLRRISQTINDPPQIEVYGATAPLPCVEVTAEKITADPETADMVGDSKQKPVEALSEDAAESSRVTHLANHEAKPLRARLSFGGFLAKLPSRPKPTAAGHEPSSTFKFNIFETEQEATYNLPGSFQENDINAEELPEMSSEEDISDDYSVKQMKGEDSHCSVDLSPDDIEEEEKEDDVFLPGIVTKSQKRPCLESGHEVFLEPKRKHKGSASNGLGWDGNITEEASNVMTRAIDATDSSDNSTYLKSEATLESTYKHSQCDSQMDQNLDYEFDYYKKIEDGSITVNEFLKYFGIDFVIHRSRPSILPDNFSPKQRPNLEDLLKEAYIYRPKQKIFEADCGKLADMEEGLKSRIKEQEYPLRHINGSLLQELSKLSTEELQIFESTLKERKVYFRKKSKITLHEMKAGMYSELAHTTREAKQQLKQKLLEADTLLTDLNACIHDLKDELAVVESSLRDDQVHAQTDMTPVLKKKQEELDHLNRAVDERRRQIVHMETENKNKAEKLDRLQEEIKDIKEHTSELKSSSEWKLKLKEDGRIVFSFLHDTLFLEVVHEPCVGVLPNESDQKLLDISFNFQLDAENAESHHVMVHDLLSQVLSETDWLKSYSTTRGLPMLLLDVSLAVSHKHLLWDEIHRLDRWGALRLDILKISCADRRVQIVFSSLEAFVKFTLTLAITPAYPFGGVTIHDFQNRFGNTRVEQIEEVLLSIEPGRGYLTSIIKKIHDRLFTKTLPV